MTFDEIFQQYVAQGFTKPTAGVSGIETLMPTQAMPIAPITPIQQPQGQDGNNDNNTNVIDPSQTNAGITSLSDAIQGIVDLYGQLPTPINLAMKGIQNFQNPNTTIFGQPTREYQQQLEKTTQTINQNKQYFSGDGGDNGGRGNIGSDGADYSGSAQTGAKGGFGYGL
ncbi:hypothetical protein ACFL3Q_16020 [Planctomycetota bacterium]